MAVYAGFDLGLVFEMNTSPNPKARQVNDYPGADGLEVLDLGSRGRRTPALIGVGASTPSALDAILQGLSDLHDAGTANTLVNHLGRVYTGVILEQFAPVGRVYRGGPGYVQRCQVVFLHIL